MIKNYTLSGNTDYRICFKDYMSIELFKNTLCDCLLRYFFDNNNFRYNINNVKASYNPIL